MTRAILPQTGRTIEIPAGETLLGAALGQSIDYPHGCRSGRCGACKSRLLDGEVDLLPHTPFALSAEERAQGLILACRALPRSDVTVAWLGDEDEVAEFPVRRLPGHIASLADATHDIKILRIALDDRRAFDFRPGQYARLTYAGAPPRDYSMASRPDEELLEFHVRRVPGGATSCRIFDRARSGDPVSVEGPFGSAFLREKHAGPILAAAGGSGLAPVKAIVETALAKGMRQPIHVYVGARSPRDLYMVNRFAVLAQTYPSLNFVPALSNETASDIRAGPVSKVIGDDITDMDGWKAYLAGPPAMVEATGSVLLERGIRAADIHADVFFTPEELAFREGRDP